MLESEFLDVIKNLISLIECIVAFSPYPMMGFELTT